MNVASTVWTLANGIRVFIAAHKEKTATTIEIQELVELIQTYIDPLFSHPNELKVNKALNKSLHLLHGTLLKTHNHLRLWSKSRKRRVIAWFLPWVVTQVLKADRQSLLEYHTMLMFGVIWLDRDQLHGYHVFSNLPQQTFLSTPLAHPPEELSSSVTPGQPRRRANPEVTNFWDRCVGYEVGYFCIMIYSRR
jgi:hypothetical protein